MHVPDGFLDVPTSVATATAATGAVAVALRKAHDELDERTAPLAGLVSAFVFAVQMLNFPVGVGTSGHLMGGALAAVLVGPWTALLCLTVVLLVQALLFADGGTTALGTNVLLIGVVTVVVGWAVTRLALAVLPRRPRSVVPAAALGALVSVPVAAAVFAGLFAVGGGEDLPLGTLLATMVGWHVLIGVGEAVITGLTVSAVVAVRPDLVRAARDLVPALVLRDAQGRERVPAPRAAPAPPRVGRRGVLLGGLGVTLLLAGVASSWASSSPDGLERVAEDRGFLDTAREHAVTWGLGDYGGVGGIPVGVAGVLGVAVVVLLGTLLFRLVAARRAEGRRELERTGA
jgi:cobalt/nickel transport system permease protein